MRCDDEKTETTLGELVEAVSESALELCADSQEAYALASVVLEKILKTHDFRNAGLEEAWNDVPPGPITFH